VLEKTVMAANRSDAKRSEAKRETLNLRVKPEDRELIARAATLLGKTRTDFLLDAGRRAAQNALLDRTLFNVSPEDYARFVERLDAAPAPNEKLRRMMTTKAPWE
jgi:uncharacterized protein (DUF1778 family)